MHYFVMHSRELARTISLRLPPSLIEAIDEAAVQRPTMTRTQFIRNAVEEALDAPMPGSTSSGIELSARAREHLTDLIALFGGNADAIVGMALKHLLMAELQSEEELLNKRQRIDAAWSDIAERRGVPE